MNFTNRITSTPFFDLDAYKDIARDEKGTKSALGVVLLAGLSCGAGLHGKNPFGWIDGAVFTFVVITAATAAAFIAAHKFDRAAWSLAKAARCVRILGYSLAPGIFGVVGMMLDQSSFWRRWSGPRSRMSMRFDWHLTTNRKA